MDNDHAPNRQDNAMDAPPPVERQPTDRRETPPPVPRPKRRGGCLKGLLIVLLVFGGLGVLLFAVVATGIGGFLAQFDDPRPGRKIVEDVLLRLPGVDDKVVVIDVKGIIGTGSPYDGADSNRLRAELRQAAADPHVVAVVLDLDTPGGEVIASDEVHHMIRQLREKHGKPVVACMRSVCASGGYYIAVAADHIVANPMTLTGSIGVIVPTVQFTELLDKIGIKFEPYKSGAMKDMLSGAVSRPQGEEMLIESHMRDLVRTIFQRFAQVVADGRPMYDTAEDVMNARFGDGRILLGADALSHGLVDQLGYFDEAIETARELAGVYEAGVVRYRRSLTLRDMLFAMQQPREVRIESQILQFLGEANPRKLYYLMPLLGAQ